MALGRPWWWSTIPNHVCVLRCSAYALASIGRDIARLESLRRMARPKLDVRGIESVVTRQAAMLDARLGIVRSHSGATMRSVGSMKDER